MYRAGGNGQLHYTYYTVDDGVINTPVDSQ